MTENQGVFQHRSSRAVLNYDDLSAERKALPLTFRNDIRRWMHKNNVFFGNRFVHSSSVLNPFFESWQLLDEDKSQKARDFFKSKAQRIAKNFTYAVKKDNGYDADPLPGGQLCSPSYKAGYEYIHEPGWNGVLNGRLLTAFELLQQLTQTISTFSVEQLLELSQMVQREQCHRQHDYLGTTDPFQQVLDNSDDDNLTSISRRASTSSTSAGRSNESPPTTPSSQHSSPVCTLSETTI